ncbi:MAG TPA: hypothetical protein VGN08_02090 [Solirubrobacteraceae bacterium]|jgi:hypothetical protein
MNMRTVRRPRRYIDGQWLSLLAPAFRYSRSRDAFVLRGIGRSLGPVLRADRRGAQRPFKGADRRRAGVARRSARVA